MTHSKGNREVILSTLNFKGKRIFGDDSLVENLQEAFNKPNLNWDGHCWVVLGKHVAEISLFRTAYAAIAPQWLKDMIINEFGENRGMILGNPDDMKRIGLVYSPKYVFTDSQITGIIKGARLLF